MFAVIYKAKIKTGKEEAYQDCWHKIATYFIAHKGAIGSCLHKTNEGIWIAYSRWPTKDMRDAAWSPAGVAMPPDFPEEIKMAAAEMKDCFSEQFPEECMEVIEDLLR